MFIQFIGHMNNKQIATHSCLLYTYDSTFTESAKKILLLEPPVE